MKRIKINVKSILLTTVLSLFLLSLVACSTNADSDSSSNDQGSSSGETLTIDTALFYTENDAYNTAFKKWAEQIEEETEGRVSFNPFYSGSLVALFETLDAVSSGTVDAGILSAGAISGQIPSMGLLEVLGTFQSEEHFKAVYEEATPLLDEILEKENVKLLYWGLGSTDNLVPHKEEHLTELEQFKGVKMRSQGRWMSRQLELIDAVPVSMDPSELYLALQNGTVDSTFQGASLVASQKLYEVSPNLVSTGFSVNAIPYVVNQEVWDKISPEDQEVIENISKEIGLESYSLLQEREEEDRLQITEEGSDLYFLEDDERLVLLEKLKQVRTEIVESGDDYSQQLLEIIEAHEQD